jgi:hypothetical protein
MVTLRVFFLDPHLPLTSGRSSPLGELLCCAPRWGVDAPEQGGGEVRLGVVYCVCVCVCIQCVLWCILVI